MGESLVVAGNTAGCMRPGGTSLTETALSRCSFPAGARLLDVGCGCAGTVECLLGHRFNAFGIDPSLTALRQGLERNDSLPLISAVGENLPFADGAWDGVFLECVLSIIRDSDRVLHECRRVLKEEGQLILNDLYLTHPKQVGAVGRLPSNCCLAHAMTRDELLGILSAHHFQVTFWEDHSPALKAFVAQLIFAYGSLEKYFCRVSEENGGWRTDLGIMREAVARVKAGYCLLIARKSTNG